MSALWRYAAIVLSLWLGACSSGVERGRTTTPRLHSIGRASLVLGELGRPSQAVAIGPTQQMGMQTLQAGLRRLDRAERRLLELFSASQVTDRVVASADLGPEGAPDPAFVVSYRVLNYDEHFDGPDGRYWAGFMLGCITAGIGFLIAIDSHANSSHSFEFEVRVFDVRGASMVRVTRDDGTIENVYDTSVAAPLMRRTYHGNMHTWIGAGGAGPSGPELDRYMDAQGDEVARVMFDESAEDVAAAIAAAAAATPASATSGGEHPIEHASSWSDAAVLAAVRALQTRVDACMTPAHRPARVALDVSAEGRLSISRWASEASPEESACVTALLGSVDLPGEVDHGRTASVRFDGAAASSPAPDAAATGSAPAPDVAARSIVDGLHDVVLACTDGAPVAVTATWTATGELSLSLSGAQAGTPSDGCVHAAGGGARIVPAPGFPGSVLHPVH